MNRVLARIATTLLAVPLAVGFVAGAAEAGVVVPGCYGGVTPELVVCDLTVTVGVPVGVEAYDDTIPVCVVTCYEVPLTLVRTTAGEEPFVCIAYTTLNGDPRGFCQTVAPIQVIVDNLVATVNNVLDNGICALDDVLVDCGD